MLEMNDKFEIVNLKKIDIYNYWLLTRPIKFKFREIISISDMISRYLTATFFQLYSYTLGYTRIIALD